MGGELLNGQRRLFRPRKLTNDVACSLMDGHPTPQIGKREGSLAIAAVSGSEEGEKRVVFGNRQQLAIAKRPVARGKVAAKHHDLSDIGFCWHGCGEIRIVRKFQTRRTA